MFYHLSDYEYLKANISTIDYDDVMQHHFNIMNTLNMLCFFDFMYYDYIYTSASSRFSCNIVNDELRSCYLIFCNDVREYCLLAQSLCFDLLTDKYLTPLNRLKLSKSTSISEDEQSHPERPTPSNAPDNKTNVYPTTKDISEKEQSNPGESTPSDITDNDPKI